MMPKITKIGWIASERTNSASWFGMPVSLMKLAKISAPISTTNNIDVVTPVSASTRNSIRRSSTRLNRVNSSAPNAPMPAASVGVKAPT